ncbi:hypothetical protein KCP70_23040 [Salmonella enterica subsp. enterica]|nr:hypothetical protein KCP70_23040 [Salmonella enterica subsp. enterica]
MPILPEFCRALSNSVDDVAGSCVGVKLHYDAPIAAQYPGSLKARTVTS